MMTPGVYLDPATHEATYADGVFSLIDINEMDCEECLRLDVVFAYYLCILWVIMRNNDNYRAGIVWSSSLSM